MEAPSYGLLRLLELSVVTGKNDTVTTSKKVGGIEGCQGKFQLKITEDDSDEQNNADDDDDDDSDDDDDDHDDIYLDEEATGVKTESSPESSLNLPLTVCAICLRPVIVFAWSTLRDTALVSFSVTPHFKTLLCFLYKSLPTMKHFSPIR